MAVAGLCFVGLVLCLNGAASQQQPPPGFDNGRPQPPRSQSFQRINFFGPLSANPTPFTASPLIQNSNPFAFQPSVSGSGSVLTPQQLHQRNLQQQFQSKNPSSPFFVPVGTTPRSLAQDARRKTPAAFPVFTPTPPGARNGRLRNQQISLPPLPQRPELPQRAELPPLPPLPPPRRQQVNPSTVASTLAPVTALDVTEVGSVGGIRRRLPNIVTSEFLPLEEVGRGRQVAQTQEVAPVRAPVDQQQTLNGRDTVVLRRPAAPSTRARTRPPTTGTTPFPRWTATDSGEDLLDFSDLSDFSEFDDFSDLADFGAADFRNRPQLQADEDSASDFNPLLTTERVLDARRTSRPRPRARARTTKRPPAVLRKKPVSAEENGQKNAVTRTRAGSARSGSSAFRTEDSAAEKDPFKDIDTSHPPDEVVIEEISISSSSFSTSSSTSSSSSSSSTVSPTSVKADSAPAVQSIAAEEAKWSGRPIPATETQRTAIATTSATFTESVTDLPAAAVIPAVATKTKVEVLGRDSGPSSADLVNVVFVPNLEPLRPPSQSAAIDQNRSESAGIDQNQPESAGIDQNRQKSAGIDQNQPESAGIDQKQLELAGIDQNRSESAGIEQNRSESAGIDQNQPESAGNDQNRQESAGTDKNHPESIEIDPNRSESAGIEQNRPESAGIEQSQPKSSEIDQNRSESAGIDQNQPESAGINQKQPESSEIDQNKPKSTEIDQKQPESSEIDQNRSESAGIDPNQPKSSEIDQNRSESAGIGKNQPESAGIDQNRQKSSEIDQNRSESSEIGQNRAESTAADRQSKAIDSGSSKGNIQQQQQLLSSGKSATSESSIDELDRFQSELSGKHVADNLHIAPSRTFERPRRPFDFLESTTMTSSTTSSTPTTTMSLFERLLAKSQSTPKEGKVTLKQENVISFLPPGFRNRRPDDSDPVATTTPKTATTSALDGFIVEEDDVSKFLPPGFQLEEKKEKKPEISGFLPPGFRNPHPSDSSGEETTSALDGFVVKEDDVSAFLPPGFQLPEGPPIPSTTPKSTASALDKFIVKEDDISAFLPPGFKLPQEPVEEEAIDIPQRFPPPTTTPSLLDKLLVKQDDISAFLPPGFKIGAQESGDDVTASVTSSPAVQGPTTTTRKSGLVFPTRGAPAPSRITTEAPVRHQSTTNAIKKFKTGWPVRETTEFTGWPTSPTPAYVPTAAPSTLPTTAATRAPTTTTTTTPRVTTVGLCGSECRLAGTIRLTDGVQWIPELSDHNTREFYQLASQIENELDAIYQSGPLAPWYIGIEVEAFSRGSVLVDYYLMLNGTIDLDTAEIRNYFHLSLDQQEEKMTFGNFTVDPVSTDFIVQRNIVYVDEEETQVLKGEVSEWIIAVIVVALASLIFVIAFGATVLFRRRRQHKRKSVPLTEEMLNELNKNHMSGVDNLGNDSFYDVGDAWDHRSYPSKPTKTSLPRPASEMAIRNHASYNNFRPALHDSWKSEWDGYYGYSHSNGANSSKSRPALVNRPGGNGRYSAAPSYGRPRSAYNAEF